MEATLFVPHERRQHVAGGIDMAHVAGEGGHVVGGVGQLQHRFADDLTGALRTEGDGLVAVGRDNGKLLDEHTKLKLRTIEYFCLTTKSKINALRDSPTYLAALD